MPTEPEDSPPLERGDAATFDLEEFRQLRMAIRERGTVRAVVSFITFVSWGAVAIAVHRSDTVVLQLVSLLVLVGGFEVAFALHVGAERIGRYLYVFYEGTGKMPKWESTIALFGQSGAAKATRLDALLAPEFVVATLVNLLAGPRGVFVLPHALADRVGLILVLGFHAVFLGRIARASRAAAHQRDADTAAFRQIASRPPL